MPPLIRSGYDFDITALLELDGVPDPNAGTYTMVACLVDERKRVRLFADEAATSVGGGVVRIQFSPGNTASVPADYLRSYERAASGAYQRQAWIELAIVTAGKRLPVAHLEAALELGWVGVR